MHLLCFESFQKAMNTQALNITAQNCVSITDQPLDIAGTTQLALSFPSSSCFSYSGTFLVSSTLFPPLECVSGWDFTTFNDLQLSSSRNGAYFLLGKHGSEPLSPFEPQGSCLPTPDSKSCDMTTSDTPPSSHCLLVQSVSPGPVPVTSQHNICIRGRTEVLINCYLPKSSKEQLGMISPIDNSEFPSSLLAACTVCQAQNRNVVVRVMNTSNIYVELQTWQKYVNFVLC